MCCRPSLSVVAVKDNSIVVAVQPLDKADLTPIFSIYNTKNPHPVQVGGKQYAELSLLFVKLEVRLKLSTGKYEGTAVFRDGKSSGNGPFSTADNWVPLLQAIST